MSARTIITRAARPATLSTPRILPALLRAHQSTTSSPPTSSPTNPLNPTGAPQPPPPTETGILGSLASLISRAAPDTADAYFAHGATKSLYLECASQASYPISPTEPFSASAAFWFHRCNREPSFANWANVTILHMWMIVVRMRALKPEQGGPRGIWQQHFIDHFFYEADELMGGRYKVNNARKTGFMKDLYEQYRGMTAGFDEGLIGGDAVLATAIWRNLFDARDDVDIEVLAMITAYVRRIVSRLGEVDDGILMNGKLRFGLPEQEADKVRAPSRLYQQVEQKVLASAQSSQNAQKRSISGP